ncbi:MAG: glycosyltransferase [Nitrospirae bacterium]|nr:glycosyltransferase [Nitrospirota bacterium]
MCFYMSDQEQWLSHDYDFNLEIDYNPVNRPVNLEKGVDFFLYAVENYDIFHFHSGFSLFRGCDNFLAGNCSELHFLKKLGKKIIMHWWGCDRRTYEIDAHYRYSACLECVDSNRQWCASKDEEIFRKIERYADVQLSNGDICSSLPYIKWFNNAIDTDLWRPMTIDEIPDRYRLPHTENIRIFHSFGNSKIRGDVKGTREVTAAVERLRSEGHPVEFVFFDKIPNKELRYYQVQADIVVDQLRAGSHGSTAVECMACGKPVITYIRPEVAAIAPNDHPLIHATLETIYEVLKELIENAERRRAIGQSSREYALREHSCKVIGERLLELYGSL